MPSFECSCLQPQRILQPNIHLPQGGVLHGTEPMAIVANTTENLHHGCWECSEQALPQELQECWLLRKEFLSNQPTLTVAMGTTLGLKRARKMLQSCLSSTANDQ